MAGGIEKYSSVVLSNFLYNPFWSEFSHTKFGTLIEHGNHWPAYYKFLPKGHDHDAIFTMRRYASVVLAVVVCLCVRPSVCPSVRHKPVLYQNGCT